RLLPRPHALRFRAHGDADGPRRRLVLVLRARARLAGATVSVRARTALDGVDGTARARAALWLRRVDGRMARRLVAAAHRGAARRLLHGGLSRPRRDGHQPPPRLRRTPHTPHRPPPALP